jgi:hypothetical protein
VKRRGRKTLVLTPGERGLVITSERWSRG